LYPQIFFWASRQCNSVIGTGYINHVGRTPWLKKRGNTILEIIDRDLLAI